MVSDDPLWAAIRAAHERWSPTSAGVFPPSPGWEQRSGVVGAEISLPSQSVSDGVPTDPTDPTQKQDEWSWPAPATDPDDAGEWEERAAILEFDAGLSRLEAERLARASAVAP